MLEKRLTNIPTDAMAVTRDGEYLVSGGHGGIASLWHIDSGLEAQQFKCKSAIHAVAVTANQICVVTGDDIGRVVVWSRRTGKILRYFQRTDTRVSAIAISPNDRFIIHSTRMPKAHIFVSELSNGRHVRELRGHGNFSLNRVHSLAVSPDGLYVAVAHEYGIGLWCLETGSLVLCDRSEYVLGYKMLGHNTVAFTPDGRYMAASGASGLEVWSKAIRKRDDDDDDGCGGSQVGDDDESIIEREYWELVYEEEFDLRRVVYALGAIDNQHFVIIDHVSSMLTGHIWNIDERRDISSFTSSFRSVSCMALAPDGQRIFLAGDCVRDGIDILSTPLQLARQELLAAETAVEAVGEIKKRGSRNRRDDDGFRWMLVDVVLRCFIKEDAEVLARRSDLR